MKFRNVLSLIVTGVLLISCNPSGTSGSGSVAPVKVDPNAEITLTAEEEILANKNSNIIAQMLVKKAVLKEMAANPFNEEQKKQLTQMKEDMELDYYLSSIAQTEARKAVVVTDEEVEAVFEANKEKLGDNVDPNTVKPHLKQAIYNQKFFEIANSVRINLLNQYIEKHKLNDILKKYVPESTTVPPTTGNTPAANEGNSVLPVVDTNAPAPTTTPAATEAPKPTN